MPCSRALRASLLSLLLPLSQLAAQVSSNEYAERRDRLMARVDSGVVLAFGAAEEVQHWPPLW